MSVKGLVLLALLATAVAYIVPSEEDNGLLDTESEFGDDYDVIGVQEDDDELTALNDEETSEQGDREFVMKSKITFSCKPCKWAVGKLILSRLLKSDSKEEAEDKLTKKCQSLPFIPRTACKRIAKKYFNKLWKYAEQGMSPESICTKVDLC